MKKKRINVLGDFEGFQSTNRSWSSKPYYKPLTATVRSKNNRLANVSGHQIDLCCPDM